MGRRDAGRSSRPARGTAGAGRLRLRRAALLLLCLLPVDGGAVARPAPLRVSAAVSLLPPLREIAELFRQAHPEVRVELNGGGSGVLLQQARRGAPVDLFVSASVDELVVLEREGRLLPGSRRALASNRLVVLTRPGDDPPTSVERLASTDYDLVAVGNPRTAPLGRYTLQALERLGLLDAVRSRLVYAENARQVVEYVARGEVAAGVAYATDAALGGTRVRRGPTFPPDVHAPIEYVGAVLRGSTNPVAATQFLQAIVSDTGVRVLDRHGFLPPP